MKRYKLMGITREWRKRSCRENYFQNVKWLEKHAVPLTQISQNALPWVFSHQYGVKSSVLESYLTQLFSQLDIMHFDEDELLELPQLLSMKKSQPKYISGVHSITSVLYQMLNSSQIVHLTMLKEPISRVIACYNNIATQQYQNKEKSISALNFDSLISNEQRELINNAQAKSLAGLMVDTNEISDNELYFYAKYAIDNCFSIVGVTDYFSEFIGFLRNKTGVNLVDLPNASNNQTKIILTNITKKQIKRIKEDNVIDQQLHDYAKSKFEDLLRLKNKKTNVVSFFSL